MEIRRKKKRSAGDRFLRSILPLGGCALVLFFTTILCLRSSLENQRPGTVTRDIHYQLNNRLVPTDSAEDSDYTDPGADNKPLTSDVQSRVETMRLPRPLEPVDENLPYDIHKCPPVIPKNYPFQWSTLDVLKHWNPDETEIPDKIYQGLCAIDWRDPSQRKIAVHYRTNELPFIVKNHPEIWGAVDRWSSYEYLYGKLGDNAYRNEHVKGNHMMYWKLRGNRKGPAGWQPPTNDVDLAFPDWYNRAREIEEDQDSSTTAEHYYLRLNGAKEGHLVNEWLYDDLPFFDPEVQNDVFMVDPSQSRGINCRLGSRGIIAEAHYDQSRNLILILQGRKRYILAHPDQCVNMELYPQHHPSGRHSSSK